MRQQDEQNKDLIMFTPCVVLLATWTGTQERLGPEKLGNMLSERVALIPTSGFVSDHNFPVAVFI